jgi:hypothetical protein
MPALRTGRSLFALLVGTFVVLAACDDAPGTTSTSSSSTGGSMSASETVGVGGAKAHVTGLIDTAAFGVNCQPVVQADPVSGSFGAKYVNDGMLEGDVDIVSAKIIFTLSAKKLTWTFDVTPDVSGPVPPNGSTNVPHTKVDGSGVGSDASMHPCDFCAGTARLEVTWKDKTIQQMGEKSLGLVQCTK